MPIPAAFLKKGKAAEGSKAEEKSESPMKEKGEGPEYGDVPHGKKPCAACKKKGKKKGSCGCAAKAAMDAALTPMEYLDACDLGIQNRSRAYVRGVLSVREDKKCGGSGIAENKKCGKGSGGGIGKGTLETAGKVLVAGAAIGGVVAGARHARAKGMAFKAKNVGAIKEISRQRSSMGNHVHQAKTTESWAKKNLTGDYQQNALVKARREAAQYANSDLRSSLRLRTADLATRVPQSPARRRKAAKNGDAPVGLKAKMKSYMGGN